MQREAELLNKIEHLERELLAARQELTHIQKLKAEAQARDVKTILAERVALFAKRFQGRTDVWAKRFEFQCALLRSNGFDASFNATKLAKML